MDATCTPAAWASRNHATGTVAASELIVRESMPGTSTRSGPRGSGRGSSRPNTRPCADETSGDAAQYRSR